MDTGHIRQHFLLLAQGGPAWRTEQLTEDLRADRSNMTALDVSRANEIARNGTKKAQSLWADGQQDEARRIASETAAQVADLMGDAILSANHAKDEAEKDLGPRELAAKILRR